MGNKAPAKSLKELAEDIRNHPNADRESIAAGFELIADALAAKAAPAPAKTATKSKAA